MIWKKEKMTSEWVVKSTEKVCLLGKNYGLFIHLGSPQQNKAASGMTSVDWWTYGWKGPINSCECRSITFIYLSIYLSSNSLTWTAVSATSGSGVASSASGGSCVFSRVVSRHYWWIFVSCPPWSLVSLTLSRQGAWANGCITHTPGGI